MREKISVFRSAEGEAQYHAAYNAVLKQWPVPYEELFMPTRFGDTYVIVSGPVSANSLVLLPSSGSGAVQWIKNIAAFSQHYRTYAIDVIGEEGKSVVTHPICNHWRQNFAIWMKEIFDGLSIDSTYIVGNSLGGFLTFNTALYLPERVKKIVLISPAATFVQMWPWYWNLLIPRGIYLSTPAWIGDRLNLVRLVNRAFAWIWKDFPIVDPMAKLRTIRNIAGHPRNRIFPPVYSDKDLRQVQTPILLLIGEHEVIYKPEDAVRRATRLVPNLKAEILPNANHSAQVTAPELVNVRILDFLAE